LPCAALMSWTGHFPRLPENERMPFSSFRARCYSLNENELSTSLQGIDYP